MHQPEGLTQTANFARLVRCRRHRVTGERVPNLLNGPRFPVLWMMEDSRAMSRPPEIGVCILSIDFDCHAPRLDELGHATSEVAIPVTWAMDAVRAEDFSRIVGQHIGDEVALLAEATWAAEGSPRRHFADRLMHSLTHLSSAGFHPTTLVLPSGRLPLHDDLLVKHGIRLVRVHEGRQSQGSYGWWPKARSTVHRGPCTALRWGLWEVVTTCDLSLVGVRGAQRVVDRLCRQGGLAVLVASAERQVSDHRAAATLIAHLHRRQTEGAVRLETLASLSARLQATRPTTPAARSILHAAA
jgi:hypothetical protein